MSMQSKVYTPGPVTFRVMPGDIEINGKQYYMSQSRVTYGGANRIHINNWIGDVTLSPPYITEIELILDKPYRLDNTANVSIKFEGGILRGAQLQQWFSKSNVKGDEHTVVFTFNGPQVPEKEEFTGDIEFDIFI